MARISQSVRRTRIKFRGKKIKVKTNYKKR